MNSNVNGMNIFVVLIIFSSVSLFSNSSHSIELSDMCESDCKNELQFFRKYSQKGSSLADFSLSIMYYRGIGTERNVKTATRLLYKAARAGEPGAQYQLGYFLMHGLYLEQDLERSRAWFKRALKKNTLDSKVKIAEIDNLISNNERPILPTIEALSNKQNKNSVTPHTQIERITVMLNVDYRQILEAAEAQACKHESCSPNWTHVLAPLIKLVD